MHARSARLHKLCCCVSNDTVKQIQTRIMGNSRNRIANGIANWENASYEMEIFRIHFLRRRLRFRLLFVGFSSHECVRPVKTGAGKNWRF